MGFDPVSYLIGKAGGGGGGSYPWFGPGTEKVDAKQQIINLAEDTSWESWTPSTTSGTILATPSEYQYEWDVDLETYDYYVISTLVTRVALKESATRKKIPTTCGRVNVAEVYGLPSTYPNWRNGVRDTTLIGSSYAQSTYYYDNGGGLSATNSGFGPMVSTIAATPVATWPSKIKWKRPDIKAKCDSTCFDTARAGDIDADNTNMTIDIELYRTPIAGSLMAVEIEQLRQKMNA